MHPPYFFRGLCRSFLSLIFAFTFFFLSSQEVRAAAGDIVWDTQQPIYGDWVNPKLATAGGKIYAIGKYWTWIYNPLENYWEWPAPEVPTPRAGMGVVGAEGKIYTIGGSPSDVPDDVHGQCNEMEEYNPQTNTWRSRSPLLTKRTLAGVAELDGKIYVAGGRDCLSSPSLSSFEVFDPVANSWSGLPPMPTPRAGLALVAARGKLYAIGGQSCISGLGCPVVNTLEVYDPKAASWSTKAPLAFGRVEHGAVGLDNGRIYVFGGRASNMTLLNSVVQYDPDTDSWTNVGVMSNARYDFGIVKVTGSNIYLIGGYTGPGIPTTLNERATVIYPWTIMFYLAHDNDFDRYTTMIMQSLREEAAANPNIHLVVLLDRPDLALGANYYWLAGDPKAPFVEGENKWYKGILDAGDPKNLVDFVTIARSVFPAQHYALVLSDHGSGLTGAMTDESSPKDTDEYPSRLTLKEIRQALETVTENGAKKIDVLYMEACNMGMLETAFQVRGFMDYFVASESKPIVSNLGYAKYVSAVKSDTTPFQLATQFVDAFADFVLKYTIPGTDDDYYRGYYTMSVADIARLNSLVNATGVLAKDLTLKLPGAATLLKDIVEKKVFKFASNIEFSIDLYDFAVKVQEAFFLDDSTKMAAQGVMNAVKSYIVYQHNGKDTRANGVSIYFPRRRSSFYRSEYLDFAEGTQWPGTALAQVGQTSLDWGPLLVQYIQITNPNGEDISTPPPLEPRELIGGYRLYLPLIQR